MAVAASGGEPLLDCKACSAAQPQRLSSDKSPPERSKIYARG